jgi:hypothetical protein
MLATNLSAQSNIDWSNLLKELLKNEHHRNVQNLILEGGHKLTTSEFQGDVEKRTYQSKSNVSEVPIEEISYKTKGKTVDSFSITTSNATVIHKIKKELEPSVISEQKFDSSLDKGNYFQYKMTSEKKCPNDLEKKLIITVICTEYSKNNRLYFDMEVTISSCS